MNKGRNILSLIFSLILLAQFISAVELVTIRIHFFQGTWMEGQPGLNKVTVLTTSSDVAELKSIVDRPENEQKIAISEALMDILDLQTVEDLFPWAMTWNGKDPTLSETILRKSHVFRLVFIPKWISPKEVALRAAIFKSKEGALGSDEPIKKELEEAVNVVKDETKMEKIMDQTIDLEVGDPVIVGIPDKNQVYFMMILLTSGKPGPEQKASKEAKEPELTEILAPPKPVRQILPVYPEQFRQQGVEGEVKLRVSIDQKGEVQNVKVLKSLHPYLDFMTVQALRQWEFEPVLLKEKGVPVAFSMAVDFDPKTWQAQEETTRIKDTPITDLGTPSQAQLRMILDRCAEYCQKLAGLALDFICEETIKEIHYNLGADPHWGMYIYGPREGPITTVMYPLFDPKLTEKNSYICDYLFVKKGDKIEERRILLQKDGRTMQDRGTLLEEKKYSFIMPLFAPIRLLDRNQQPEFSFMLVKEENVDRKKGYLIEATPKSSSAAIVQRAKIWVDVKTFQILQCEIEGVPLEGYEDILEECVRFNIEPLFNITHQYQIERKGVLFPFRSTIRVAYKGPQTKGKKLKTEISYKKYKIFTVETEEEIIK